MDSLHLALSIEWDDCTVALGGAGRDCLEWSALEAQGRVHGAQASRHALSLIQQALREVGQPLSAVSSFLVNKGPGAFTALRIAAGLIQGLALPRQVPVSAIGSLEALASTVPAWQASTSTRQTSVNAPFSPDVPEEWLLCAALDARMSECYYAVYRCRAGAWPICVLAPAVGSPEEARDAFAMQLATAGIGRAGQASCLRLAGGAFRDFQPLHDWALAHGHDPHEVGARRPTARAILQVGMATGAPLPGPAREAQPLYVRDRVALDRFEQREAAVAREARRLQTARSAARTVAPDGKRAND